jgi:hypothetical protein
LELKNANSNGDYYFENCNNWVKKQKLYVVFSTRCWNCRQNITPHIIHLTNQNEMNQSFPCRYGFILEGNFFKYIYFRSFSSFFVATWSPYNITIVLKVWWKINLYIQKTSIFPHLQKTFQRITMEIDIMDTCPTSICLP